MTNTVLQRTGADRGIAFAAYGLLATSMITAGLTGLVAAVLAYASRGQVSPVVKRHLNAVIGMFWVTLLLWLVCIGCVIAATVIEVDDLSRGSNDYLARLQIAGWSIDVSRWRLVPEVVGLVMAALVTGVVGAAWSFVAPAIGVIRLASQHTKVETTKP